MGLMVELNPDEAVTAVGGKPKMWVEPNPGEEVVVAAKAVPPRFRPKKGGVIPPKRKLVKRMMFESILSFIATLFHRGSDLASAGDSPSTLPPKTPNANRKNKICSDSAQAR